MAATNGDIPIAEADPPAEEAARIEEMRRQSNAENKIRAAQGEAPLPPPLFSKWFTTAPKYSSQLDNYVAQRMRSFYMTLELRNKALKRQSSAHWEARKKMFGEIYRWVTGFCIALWLLTAALGWIIRGFAGIPHGQDFKPGR